MFLEEANGNATIWGNYCYGVLVSKKAFSCKIKGFFYLIRGTRGQDGEPVWPMEEAEGHSGSLAEMFLI